ncbi:PRC and DUF2382 domain-containing protein [Arthrobacter sp. NPDC092385]|uniref:PRC and DUF2382 domain-containing protein n=1 Tax=Arthrobacter sp. NPDC092385 TaxID=3363943 RepID=UPI00382BE77B
MTGLPMLTMHDLAPLLRRRSAVVTSEGDKVGSIGEVYLHDVTEEPTWVTVHTGLFGTKESFVPLLGASVEGGHLVVTYPRELIKHAPSTERDGHLRPEDESGLYAHYGLVRSAAVADSDSAAAVTDAAVTRDADSAVTDTVADTHTDSAVADTDAAATREPDGGEPWMIRSEERLRVGTERYEAARVRLRKYVITEEATQTVPLTRDELRIEREPITTTTLDSAARDSLFQEEVIEFVGREERAVVRKETVPVERVRLGTATVTGRATVTEEVRKERIATNVREIPDLGGNTTGAGTSTDDPGVGAGGTPGGRVRSAGQRSGNIKRNSANAIIKGRNKRR